jgi:hypothetical protein
MLVAIIPAENAWLFAFKHRRRNEELLDLLTDARRQGNLSSRGDWHGQDSIVANATGAVRRVLFHAHDGERAARDHSARIGSHIPPDRGVDRIAVRALRGRHKAPVARICDPRVPTGGR